jgi:hypothetical protein
MLLSGVVNSQPNVLGAPPVPGESISLPAERLVL